MEKYTIDQPDEQIGFLLMQTYLLKQRIVNAALKRLDLTYIQFVILAGILELGETEEWLTQQTIASKRMLDKAMVSNVVKTLLKKQLVIRTEHPTDSRAWMLELTAQGREYAIEAKKIIRNVDDSLFAEADKDVLRKIFKKVLTDNIKEENGEA